MFYVSNHAREHLSALLTDFAEAKRLTSEKNATLTDPTEWQQWAKRSFVVARFVDLPVGATVRIDNTRGKKRDAQPVPQSVIDFYHKEGMPEFDGWNFYSEDGNWWRIHDDTLCEVIDVPL